jgi:Cysteine-rich CPCC
LQDSQADSADSIPVTSCVAVRIGENGAVEKFVNAEGPAAEGAYRCPCCGFITLTERSADEICPVCFWEDDGQDDHDADEERCTRFVRPPLSTELPKSSNP